MSVEMLRVIEVVARDRGLSRSIIIDAVKEGMIAAARRVLHKEGAIIEAEFDDETGVVDLFEFRMAVEEVEDPMTEISIEEARAEDPDVDLGDSLGFTIETDSFGRIAAQNAKQIIMNKLREAERDLIENEFEGREGELISGMVRRIMGNKVIVELGRAEGVLYPSDLLRNESYRSGDKVKALIQEIDPRSRGPEIHLTRASADFLRKLFELEVPEIYDGVVEIKALARDPGSRSKVAVFSHDKDIDPVGASVGMKGVRVQNIVQELRGEKIDIIQWNNDAATLIENALSPAEISQVIIDDDGHEMEVIVPDDQLSLAIGRKGQNVKLAVELTGWKINIISETHAAEMSAKAKEALGQIQDITVTAIELLFHAGFQSVEDVSQMDPAEVAEATGISETKLELYKNTAEELLAAHSEMFGDKETDTDEDDEDDEVPETDEPESEES